MNEYDEVMGITHVEPREAERFEEGSDSDFQDAEETATRGTRLGPGEIHGGFGRYESVSRELSNRVLLPLLPSTLGKV